MKTYTYTLADETEYEISIDAESEGIVRLTDSKREERKESGRNKRR